jgi:hypothetical protein
MGDLSMNWPVLVGIAVLPYITFRAGSWIMGRLSGRREVVDRLEEKLSKKERVPLNQRLLGYDLAAVRRLWGALDAGLLEREQTALRLDRISPLLYGAALAASLLLAWRFRGQPFAGWLLLPPAIYALADWTENLVQLRQLRLYRQAGPDALESDWVRVAGRATTIKLIFFIGGQLLVVALALTALWRTQ